MNKGVVKYILRESYKIIDTLENRELKSRKIILWGLKSDLMYGSVTPAGVRQCT